MSVRKNIVVLFLSALALSACTKDIIDMQESTDPVFITTGQFNDDAFEIVAGDDGAYMHTMTKEENGVRIFSGRIEGQDLTIELGVFDGMIDMPNHDVVQHLTNITPEFASHEMGELMVLSKSILTTQDNSANVEYVNWYVDGEFVGQNNVPLYEPGIFDVCAVVKFGGTNIIDTLCNEMIVGYSRNDNCLIDFDVAQGMLNASITPTGSATVESVRWFLDGNFVGDDLALDSSVSQTRHELSAEVHLSNGTYRTKRAIVDGTGDYNSMDDFTILENIASAQSRDFDIRIRVEKDGSIYYSEIADNSNATLTILGIELYEQNANGKDVYKITATVDAQVRESVALKTIPISFTTVFGIEIP